MSKKDSDDVIVFSPRGEAYMKKYIYIACAVFLAFFLAVYVYEENRIHIQFPANADGKMTAIPLSKEFQYILKKDTMIPQRKKESMFCVSMAQYNATSFLTAGYGVYGIQMVDIQSGDSWLIQPENLEKCEVMGGSASLADRKTWNPAGLYFDHHTQLLYVANYTGHNILIGQITDKGTFDVEKMIVAEGLISPENVAVNEAGSRIAAADYDGNNVFLFDGNGNTLWRKDVLLAHGVEISDSAVYGTSLGTREIIQFDYDGNELKRVGHCASSGVNAYMWPTALELYQGKLIVTDPHTGRLTILNDKLEYETALGSNGPYATNFNYPYASIVAEDKLYVADTFAKRIFVIDFKGTGLAQISEEAPNMPPSGSPPYVPEYPYEMAYLFEEQVDIPPSLFCENYGNDMTVVAGYSSFWLLQGDNKIQIPIITYPVATSKLYKFCENYFYNTWSKKISTGKHEYYILGSPQAPDCIFFSTDTGLGGIVSLGKLNTFCVYGEIVGNHDQWNNMLRDMDMLTDRFSAKVAEGATRYQAYIDTYAQYYSEVLPPDDDAVSSEAGIEAWLEFQCSQTESGKAIFEAIKDGTFTEKDYYEYMKDCYQAPNTHTILERLLLRTFAGTAD